MLEQVTHTKDAFMAVTATTPAPYAPPSAIMEVVNRFRRGLPAPITTEVLGRAGISDSLIPRTLQALQTLDLVSDDGAATMILEGLRRAPEPEFQKRLAEWLNTTYADVLSFIDPATADEGAIRDAFRAYNPVGQQPRMVTLFIGLYTAAGVRTAEKAATPRAPSVRARATGIASGAGKAVARARTSTAHAAATKNNASAEMPSALAGLMASLPKDGDGWTQADHDKFMRTFSAVLEFCYPIVTQDALDAEADAEGADE